MIRLAVQLEGRMDRVLRDQERQARGRLFRAGSYIRTTARRSIRLRPKGKAAAPGRPPFAHRTRRSLRNRRAIVYQVNSTNTAVTAGTDSAFLDDSMGYLEQGGRRDGRRIPARPFMAPALAKASDNINKWWNPRSRRT